MGIKLTTEDRERLIATGAMWMTGPTDPDWVAIEEALTEIDEDRRRPPRVFS